MAKILISGYYGFDNAGDDSVLYGIISSLKKRDPSIQFSVLSSHPEKTINTFGVSAYNRWNFAVVLKQLRKHDLLVMGGGSLLQDATSPRSVFYYLGIVLGAKFFRKPVVFYAQGVGPITKTISQKLIRSIVNRVDVITVRDHGSAEDFKSLGVTNAPVVVTADPAVTIPAADIDLTSGHDHLQRMGLHKEKTIAISVRDWKKEHRFKKQIAEVADHFAEKGYDILFVPMQFPADVSSSKDIITHMRHSAYIIEEQLDFRTIMSLLGNVQMVAGMRLHSLIFAAVMNVPFVGISYDPKINRFVERVNMNSAGHIKQLDTMVLIDQIADTLADRSAYQKRLKEAMTTIIQEADKSSELTLQQLHDDKKQ